MPAFPPGSTELRPCQATGLSHGAGTAQQGYYTSRCSPACRFGQGLFQNVQETINGVDAATGYTFGLTAGRITGKANVAAARRRSQFETATNPEALMPVFASDGQVIAYERAMDPAQATPNQDTSISRMIGVWRGRQVEEYKAGIINSDVLRSLKKMYDKRADGP